MNKAICHEIRALQSDHTLKVYQAYGDPIADEAVRRGTLDPPFKMDRMTWSSLLSCG